MTPPRIFARAWMTLCSSTFILAMPGGAEGTPKDCDTDVDLAFIIDASQSIRDHDPLEHPLQTWHALTNFTRDIIAPFPIGRNTRVSAVVYGARPTVEFHLDWYHNLEDVSTALWRMDSDRGNTNTAAALRAARTQIYNGDHGARGAARNVVVFIGDGISNLDAQYTRNEARYLKEMSYAEVFIVAVSEEIHEADLLHIASEPKEHHFLQVMDPMQVGGLVDLLVHRICKVPDPESGVINPECDLPGCLVCSTTRECYLCDVGLFYDGGVCAECIPNCDVCHNPASCDKCMLGWYWEPELNKCQECELTADLAVVVDNSGSIRDKNPDDKSFDNYQILKDFIKQILRRLDIGPDNTRVSVVKFGSRAQVVFHLDQYRYFSDIQREIDAMGFGGGHTNTSGGLSLMRNSVFQEERGDRPDVRNIGIVVTDGESTVDKNLTIPEAEKAKAEGITLFVVAVTDEINEEELKVIASDPVSQHYFNSTEIKHLNDLLVNLIQHICAPENKNVAAVGRSGFSARFPHAGRRSAWQRRSERAAQYSFMEMDHRSSKANSRDTETIKNDS